MPKYWRWQQPRRNENLVEAQVLIKMKIPSDSAFADHCARL